MPQTCRSDMPQGQTPPCAPWENLSARLVERIQIDLNSCNKSQRQKCVPATHPFVCTVHAINSIDKVLGQPVNEHHLIPNNTTTHFQFLPWVIKNTVYEITCPGCNSNYIGKTERNIPTGLIKHATQKHFSAVADYFYSCQGIQHLFTLNYQYDAYIDTSHSIELSAHQKVKF